MGLENKVAIVTGGAQGIGMATSMAFAEAGAHVFVVDVDEEAGAELAAMTSAAGHAVTFIKGSVAEEDDVAAFCARVAREAGAIHVLINNAGVMDTADLTERPMDAWDRILGINLRGPYMCAKYAAPHMPQGSAIVNIASTRALMSEPNTEPYSASKGGLLALTHSLAISLAPRRIRVNCICPGWIDTARWKKKSQRTELQHSARDHGQHPVGRIGEPNDIAQACLFLADGDKSGFMTGANIVIDGGMTVKMI
ncbi:MAG: glucose 1-dehydrogenase, partial [FCB group bacterium]|nr:glucose 1-dehydrogenase [FCB group bacterium]